VTAHAVGHHIETVLAEDREVVLVVVSLLADVRFAGDFDAERFQGITLRRLLGSAAFEAGRLVEAARDGTCSPRS